MKTIYYPEDDILVVRLGDAPVVREASREWNVNLSWDAAGNVVEIVVLDARALFATRPHCCSDSTACRRLFT